MTHPTQRGSFSGMDPGRAKGLAELLDGLGRALMTAAPIMGGALDRWGGDSRGLGRLRGDAAWADDQARELRKRAFMIARNLTEDDLERSGFPAFFWELPDHAQEAWLVLNAGPAAAARFTGKAVSSVTRPLQAKQEIARYLSYRRALAEAHRAGGQHTLPGLASWFEHQDRLGRIEASKGALLRKVIGDARFARVAPVLDVASKASLPVAAVMGVKDMFWPTHDGVRGVTDRVVGGATVMAAGGLAITTFAGGSAAGLALAAAPVFAPVAAVVLAGAAAYALGNVIYDNREAIGKALSAAGSWTADRLSDAGHNIAETIHTVTHPGRTLRKMFGFGS